MRRLFSQIVKLVFSYALFGFALVPATLHLTITQLAPTFLHQPLHLGGVFFNPFKLELKLKSLKLGNPAQPLAGFQSLTVDIGLRSLTGKPSLSMVRLDRPYGDIVWLESGQLNISNWIKLSGQKSEAEPPADNDSSGFSLAVNQLLINNAAFTLTDLQIAAKTGQPYKLAIDNLNITLSDFRWPESQSSIEMYGKLDESASIVLSGSLEMPEPKVSIKTSLHHLDLAAFQPYITDSTFLDLTSGLLSISASSEWSAKQGFQTVSQLQLANLHLRDARSKNSVVRWDELNLADIKFDESKEQLTIEQLSLTKPFVRVAINEHMGINLAGLVKPSRSEEVGTPANRESSLRFALEEIQIIEGTVDFADRSFYPGFSAPISKLNGSLQGLDTSGAAPLKVSLLGQVDQYSPVQIEALFKLTSPLDDTSIRLTFDQVELTTLTPYSSRFAGYTVQKGRMSLSLDYAIHQGQLEAHNSMLLDELTLGERIESDEAIDLPLRLAIALLKDREGRIDVQLPVSGDLNNPEFELGPVLRMALTNMLTNVVAAPFDFLASLVGGDADALSSVQFDPGIPTIPFRQYKSLNQLADVLHERPGLELEITGAATFQDDWPKVARRQIDEALSTIEGQPVPANKREALLKQLAETQGFAPDTLPSSSSDLNDWLIEHWPYDDLAMRNLAIERSKSVKNYLVEQGLNPERLFILNAETSEQDLSARGIETKMAVKAL